LTAVTMCMFSIYFGYVGLNKTDVIVGS